MVIDADDPEMVAELLSPYRARLLAEGDSWFSAGGWFNGSLLTEIARREPDWLIVGCAMSGDFAHAMADAAEYGAFARLMHGTDGIPPWDALLLSAGGNDLLARIGWLVDARGVHDDRLAAALYQMAQSLQRIIDRARAIQPGIPVVLHTYDYIFPTTGARLLRPGPWVGPQLWAAGVPADQWQITTNIVVDSIGDCVDRVAARYPGVSVVHSAGTLTPAAPGWRSDWDNEIHPSARGYRRLAPLWCAAIETAMKGTAA